MDNHHATVSGTPLKIKAVKDHIDIEGLDRSLTFEAAIATAQQMLIAVRRATIEAQAANDVFGDLEVCRRV